MAEKSTADEGGVRYSITEPFTDSDGNNYENAVLLDTEFFDGISPRNWGSKLKKLVYNRSNNDPVILPITDEKGNTQQLQFAKPNERVVKNDNSNHKVIDKLSSSSDNISKLAVVHIDEIVDVSEENNPYYTNEHNHQWLDENGWLHRNANVINNKNGNIYNLTVDIAKTADGRTILYATNGQIKKVGNVHVNSLKVRGSGLNSNYEIIISDSAENVKQDGSFSLSAENTTPKKNGGYAVYGEDIMLQKDDLAPVRETATQNTPTAEQQELAPVGHVPIETKKQKLKAKAEAYQTEVDKNIQLRNETAAYYDEKISTAEEAYNALKNKHSKKADRLQRSIERSKRLKAKTKRASSIFYLVTLNFSPFSIAHLSILCYNNTIINVR